jgi:hypothetical protein
MVESIVAEKKCTGCGRTHPLADYVSLNGCQREVKKCVRCREKDKRWRDKNPDITRAYRRAYSQRPGFKEKKRENERKRTKTQKETENRRIRHAAYMKSPAGQTKIARQMFLDRTDPDRIARRRDRHLRRVFGISLVEYEEMLTKQGRVCAICKGPSGSRYYHVDHDHSTNAIRGLLCGQCNRGLGFFYDSPRLLIAARDYLVALGYE